MPLDVRQYDSAIDYIGPTANFGKQISNLANNDDKLRVKAYELYEDMYHNRPEHMRVVLRGEDEDSVEVYLPSAKKCIEAVNRFLCVEFDYYIEPKIGSQQDRDKIDAAMANLFQKQEVYRKFNQLKRYLLIKGDACLHIVGKEHEKAGNRVRIEELKPEHYFPIENPVTGDLMGCHIVDIIRNPRSTPNTKRYNPEFLTRRQTYRKVVDDYDIPTGQITSELSLWAIGRWDDRLPFLQLEWIDTIVEEFYLPDDITDLPVYHFANNPPPMSSFGMSELAGVESLVTAINQAISDEDLTLITQGLGVYWTDAAPPQGPDGEPKEWEIGPGAVVEIGSGGKFGRVSGVNSVTPYLEHILAMDESMQQAIGVPDIAIGMVDVATAESGIALSFKLGPLLAKNAEKEIFISPRLDKMLDDIVTGWFPAYEDIVVDGVAVSCSFGDPIPKNQSQLLQDLLGIFGTLENFLPVAWVFQQLNDIMGYDLTDKDFAAALGDQIREAINQAKINMITGAGQQQSGGASGGKPGSNSGVGKPAPGVFQLDNLTKYTQSERLSRQTGITGTQFGGSLTSALSSGGI